MMTFHVQSSGLAHKLTLPSPSKRTDREATTPLAQPRGGCTSPVEGRRLEALGSVVDGVREQQNHLPDTPIQGLTLRVHG